MRRVPISVRTRRILWGRSGNRCARCKRQLTEPAAGDDREALIGVECHIVSGQERGPRHRDLPAGEVDSLENLILLCRNCHQLVDEQVNEFTEERLRELKRSHEDWVANITDPIVPVRIRDPDFSKPTVLHLIETGQELMSWWGGAASSTVGDRPEPSNQAEAELLAGFLDNLSDWAEIWSELGHGARLEAEFALSEQLRELREAGFVVYAGDRQLTLEGGHGAPAGWRNAVISVYRFDDPAIRSSASDDAATEV